MLAFAALSLGLPHAHDQLPVALGIGLVLIGFEEGAAPLDHLVQGGRRRLDAGRRGRCGQHLHRIRIMGGHAPQAKSPAVQLDRDMIELDRPLDRLGREWQQAFLIGIADHEEIGADGIAEKRSRQPIGLDEGDAAAGGFLDGGSKGVARHGEVGIAGEFAGDRLIVVGDDMTVFGIEGRKRRVAACDHQIAAQDQLGTAGRDPGGLDIVRGSWRCADGW